MKHFKKVSKRNGFTPSILSTFSLYFRVSVNQFVLESKTNDSNVRTEK